MDKYVLIKTKMIFNLITSIFNQIHPQSNTFILEHINTKRTLAFYLILLKFYQSIFYSNYCFSS